MLYGTVLAEKQKCTKTNYPKAASHAIGSANSQAVQKGLVSCALTVADFEARDVQIPQPDLRIDAQQKTQTGPEPKTTQHTSN